MRVFILLTLLVSGVAFSEARAKEGELHERVVAITDVYIPSGFDSSSNSFLVVNGMFPNYCYKYKRAEVKDSNPTFHEISVVAEVRTGFCSAMLLPYHQEVPLGKLVVGDHTLRFMNGDKTYMERHLRIE